MASDPNAKPVTPTTPTPVAPTPTPAPITPTPAPMTMANRPSRGAEIQGQAAAMQAQAKLDAAKTTDQLGIDIYKNNAAKQQQLIYQRQNVKPNMPDKSGLFDDFAVSQITNPFNIIGQMTGKWRDPANTTAQTARNKAAAEAPFIKPSDVGAEQQTALKSTDGYKAYDEYQKINRANIGIALNRLIAQDPTLIKHSDILFNSAIKDLAHSDVHQISTMADVLDYVKKYMVDDKNNLIGYSQAFKDMMHEQSNTIAGNYDKAIGFVAKEGISLAGWVNKHVITPAKDISGSYIGGLNDEMFGSYGKTITDWESKIAKGAIRDTLGAVGWTLKETGIIDPQHVYRTLSDIRRTQGEGAYTEALGAIITSAIAMNYAGKGALMLLKGSARLGMKSVLKDAAGKDIDLTSMGLDEIASLARQADRSKTADVLRFADKFHEWVMQQPSQARVPLIKKLSALAFHSENPEVFAAGPAEEAAAMAGKDSALKSTGNFAGAAFKKMGDAYKFMNGPFMRYSHLPLRIQAAAQLTFGTGLFGIDPGWKNSWEVTQDGSKYVDPVTHRPVSVGRDIAGAFGTQPGSFWYNAVSGPLDLLTSFAMDPSVSILAAKGAKLNGMVIRNRDDVHNLVMSEPKVGAAIDKIVEDNQKAASVAESLVAKVQAEEKARRATQVAKWNKKGLTKAQIATQLRKPKWKFSTKEEAMLKTARLDPNASSFSSLLARHPELAFPVKADETPFGPSFLQLLSTKTTKEDVVNLFGDIAQAQEMFTANRMPSYGAFTRWKDASRQAKALEITQQIERENNAGNAIKASNVSLQSRAWRGMQSIKPVFYEDLKKFSNRVGKVGDPRSLDLLSRTFRAAGVAPHAVDLVINRLAASRSALEFKTVYKNFVIDTYHQHAEVLLQDLSRKTEMTTAEMNQMRGVLLDSFNHSIDELANPWGGGSTRAFYTGSGFNNVVQKGKVIPNNVQFPSAGLLSAHEHYFALPDYNSLDHFVRDLHTAIKKGDNQDILVQKAKDLVDARFKKITDPILKEINKIEEAQLIKRAETTATPKYVTYINDSAEKFKSSGGKIEEYAGGESSAETLAQLEKDFAPLKAREQELKAGNTATQDGASEWRRSGVINGAFELHRDKGLHLLVAKDAEGKVVGALSFYVTGSVHLQTVGSLGEGAGAALEQELAKQVAEQLPGRPIKIDVEFGSWPYHEKTGKEATRTWEGQVTEAEWSGDKVKAISEGSKTVTPKPYVAGAAQEAITDPRYLELKKQFADAIDQRTKIFELTNDYRFFTNTQKVGMTTSNFFHIVHDWAREHLIDNYFRKMTLATGSFSMRVASSELIANTFRVGGVNLTKAWLAKKVADGAAQYEKKYSAELNTLYGKLTQDDLASLERRVYGILTSQGSGKQEFYKGLAKGLDLDKMVERLTMDTLINGSHMAGLTSDHNADTFGGADSSIGHALSNSDGRNSGTWGPSAIVNRDSLSSLGKSIKDTSEDTLAQPVAASMSRIFNPANNVGMPYAERLQLAKEDARRIVSGIIDRNPKVFANMDRLTAVNEKTYLKIKQELSQGGTVEVTKQMMEDALQNVNSQHEWADAIVNHILWLSHGRGQTNQMIFDAENVGGSVFHRNVIDAIAKKKAPESWLETERLYTRPTGQTARVQNLQKVKSGQFPASFHETLYDPSNQIHLPIDPEKEKALIKEHSYVPKTVKGRGQIRSEGEVDARYAGEVTSGKVKLLLPNNIPTPTNSDAMSAKLVNKMSNAVHDTISRRVIDGLSRKPLYGVELNRQLDALEPLIGKGLTVDQVYVLAQQRAVEHAIKFVHNPQDRFVLEQWSRLYAPFWFAKNQALRRMGRLALTDPVGFERYVKLMVVVQQYGARSLQDSNGQTGTLIPGSAFGGRLLTNFLHALGFAPNGSVPIGLRSSLTSLASVFPWTDVSGVHTGDPVSMFESFRPDFGPVVALPIQMFAQHNAYSGQTDFLKGLLGPIGSKGNIYSTLLPNSALRAAAGIISSFVGSRNDTTSQINAIQAGLIAEAMKQKSDELRAQARPQALKDWAALVANGRPNNPEDRKKFINSATEVYAQSLEDEYINNATKRQALINDTHSAAMILFGVKSALSFFSPTSLTASEVDPKLQNLIRDAYAQPNQTDALNKLVEKHPEALAFIQSQSKSSSGMPLSATLDMHNFIKENKDLFASGKYNGGLSVFVPWTPKGSVFDSPEYHSELNSGLRTKYTPEELTKRMALSDGNNYIYNVLPAIINKYYNNDQDLLAQFKKDYKSKNIIYTQGIGDSRLNRVNAYKQVQALIKMPGIENRPGFKQMVPLVNKLTNMFEYYNGQYHEPGISKDYKEELLQQWQDDLASFEKKNPIATVAINSLFREMKPSDNIN